MNLFVVLVGLALLALLLLGPGRGLFWGRWDLVAKGRDRKSPSLEEQRHHTGGPFSKAEFGEFGGTRHGN